MYAILEGLDYIDNLHLSYMQIISPLTDIARRAEKGGAHRLIAREQFRNAVEQSEWWIDGNFEDFQDAGAPFDLLMGEEVHWMVFYEGPGICWTPDIDSGDSVLTALIEDEDNTLIVALELCRGYVYVVRSPNTSFGRLCKATPDHIASGIHPFDQVVVFGEDHPDYNETEGYCLPPEYLEEAIKMMEREERDDEERRAVGG